MLQVNETVIAYDLAEALSGESGKFRVSYGNQEFTVTARAGHSIASARPISHNGGSPEPWRIRKVAELRLEQEVLK